jgi:lipid-binding SYLF domain-containing protein
MRREMFRVACSLAAFAVLLVAFAAPVAATKLGDRVQACEAVIKEIMSTPDGAVPDELLEKCKGIVIIPHVVKAGFIFGGNYGEGVVCARGPKGTWSPPAFVTIGGGSWGFQAGVEAIDLVLVVMTDRGMESVLKSKVKLGADAGVAAGPVGRRVEAGTDVMLNAAIYSYSRTKGLFAGISLEGAVMNENDDAANAFYGKELSAKQILFEGMATNVPAVAKNLDETLDRLAR